MPCEKPSPGASKRRRRRSSSSLRTERAGRILEWIYPILHPCSILWMVSLILIDVNVLVYAHRPDAEDHVKYRKWLEETLNSGEICGLSELALCGMVRIVTHPGIYADPTPIGLAVELANRLRGHDSCIVVSPGGQHWQ